MKNWLTRFDYYWKGLRSQGRLSFEYKYCATEPPVISDNIIYIVGKRPYIWAIIFRCPCGCREIIYLNTLKTANPRWKHFVRWGRIYIYPSIWRRVGCKSHFHIRGGRVDWSYI